jgi:hypothetical protein
VRRISPEPLFAAIQPRKILDAFEIACNGPVEKKTYVEMRRVTPKGIIASVICYNPDAEPQPLTSGQNPS